ncbi:MAG: cell division protein ZapB [Treponema sp.]|nr:cell division protein ZapB [Treponema sp.]
MVSLEQVKLLESRVSGAINYLKKVNDEKNELKEKLDSYQKRINELELLIDRFKDDQSRIEEGILSALDRLNQFEDALEGKFPKEEPPVENTEKPNESIEEPDSDPPPDQQTSMEKQSEAGELDIF